jgi:DNA-binding IscR family transcriptional regulator
MICASHDPDDIDACSRTAFCTVNLLWVRVRDAINDAVDSLTLAELASPRLPAVASVRPPVHASV